MMTETRANSSGGSPARGDMLRGSLWMIAMRWGGRLMGLVTLAILARLLSPADYGVMAMAMIVVGLIQIFSYMNFDLAIINASDRDRSHYDTAWTLKVLNGFVLAAVIYALAPHADALFDEPRVVPVIQMLSVVAALNGLSNIATVDFRIEMNFAMEFRFNLYAKLAGLVTTISMALYLGDYWALVGGSLATAVARLVLSYSMRPYLPKICFSRTAEIWGFSRWMLLYHVANFAAQKIDTLIVSKLFGAADMGSYNVASELAYMPTTEMVMPIGRAMFPIYRKAIDESDDVGARYLDTLGTVALICLPIGLGLASVADGAVRIVLGGGWLAAIPVIEWLAVASTMTAITLTTGTFLLATGLARWNTALTWVSLAISAPAMWFAGQAYGLTGIATARSSVAAIIVVLSMFLASSSGYVQFGKVIGAIWRPAGAGLAMCLVVAGLGPPGDTLSIAFLSAQIAAGAATYVGALLLLWVAAGAPSGAEANAMAVLNRMRRR